MSEETIATQDGQGINADANGESTDDTTGEGLVKSSEERVILEFKVHVPKGFELLKHRTAFGRRGEKGKIKNEKGESVKKLWLADVQFTDIEDVIQNALANVNVSLRRVVDTGLWPEEGIPLVNSEGKFVSPPKSLEEMIEEISSEDELEKLEQFIKAQRALYAAKQKTVTVTVNNPTVTEVDPTTGMTLEQLEAATNPVEPVAKPKRSNR